MQNMLLLIDENIALPKLFCQFGLVHSASANFHQLPADTLNNIEAIIIRSKTQVNTALLQKLPKLKFIGSTVSGTDHLDQPSIQQLGVTLAIATGCNANSVAEYVISCILWHYQNELPLLTTKTLGIIGFGHVGKSLSTKAQRLGLNIKVFDPPIFHQQPPATLATTITISHHIQDMLNCDILSLHASLDSHAAFPSSNLMNAELLKQLTPQTLLINACRGELVDETALVQQCLNQTAPTLIIDCWQNEPHINTQLLNYTKLATPHIAGHSLFAKQKGSLIIARALNKFLNNSLDTQPNGQLNQQQPIINSVNSATHHPLEQLYAIIKNIYHPQQDDLNQLSAEKPIEISELFQRHRQHYPLRHEWHEYNLNAKIKPHHPIWDILQDSSIQQHDY